MRACQNERGRTFRMRTDAGRGGWWNGELMNATGGDCRLVDRVRVVRITYTVTSHGGERGQFAGLYSTV